jgi:hypothetical protein
MDCKHVPVSPPKIVAIATDRSRKLLFKIPDPDLPGPSPKYGKDILFGVGNRAPGGRSVGDTEDKLKPQMYRLLLGFAAFDETGMAKRLFDKFLAKQNDVYYFDDPDLNAAAANHDNIKYFCAAALGAYPPNGVPPPPGKTRIHQALKAADWDVTKLIAPTDLGVPAFNLGTKGNVWSLGRPTEDWNNGLGLMIDGVQHVYVIATHYFYDETESMYCITLKYVFYDVFGLDDDDLKEFGKERWYTQADEGVVAWWQLQHQHGYAPLITRIVLERSYKVPAY